jgi:CheY-like chemotaxis protein
VDDEAQLVQLGERMLRHLGYEVAAFTSSKEALEFFRAQPETIDLVITDLTMPQLTGLELSRELLQIRVDLPIILTTGFSQESIWRQAKELGVRECLLKPAALRDLADTIKRARSKSTPGGKTQEGIEL